MNDLYLELLLFINNELYNDNEISYEFFKLSEEKILNKMKG